MTPTLLGRIETRLLLLAAVGVPATLVVATLSGGVTMAGGLMTLVVVAVLGVAWELLYHLLQQLRWDKDWPSIVALAVGVPEAVVAWQALGMLGIGTGSAMAYVLHFGIIWWAVWLVAQGPMRVLAPRWRFHGMHLARPSLSLATAPPVVRLPPWATGWGVRVGRGARSPLPRWAVVSTALVVGATLATLWIARDLDSPSPAPVANSTREGYIDEHRRTERPRAIEWQVRRGWNTERRVQPTGLTIPTLEFRGRLAPVGLNPTGTLRTPPASRAGWYEEGVAPGQQGAAVIVGSMSPGGVFDGVQRVVGEDRLVVRRSDGARLMFVVDRVQRVGFASFPTAQVYADTPQPTLRLIGFDSGTAENVIVFATAHSVQIPRHVAG